jgi:hypothetical protein
MITSGANFHGASSLTCSECHQTDLFCSQCHFGPAGVKVPSGASYTHGDYPHDFLMLTTTGEVCDRCHTITKSYTAQPSTCHNCHETPPVPHPMGQEWISSQGAQFHGDPSILNLSTCNQCHDPSSFCNNCHFGTSGSKTPPGVGWTHQKSAHSQPALVSQETACVKCHSLTISFGQGPGNATCSGCHDGTYPMHTLPYFGTHMSAANDNLKSCQLCHGGTGVNFSGGVSSVECSSCHTAAMAHPTDWQGEGAYSHRDAGEIGVNCVICHDVVEGRFAPLADAPSCYSASFTNADGQTRGCHSLGWLPHASPFADPSLHGVPAKAELIYCQGCHGVPGTTSFSGGSTGVACSACHTAAKAHPTDWQGAGSYSHRTSETSGADCSICHDVVNGRIPPDPGSPSCFDTSFTNSAGQTRSCHEGGPGVPHAPPAVFVAPSAHGPEAKPDLTYCQDCHGRPGTRFFDGGTATACASCHTAAKAHPTDWQGAGAYSHRDAGNKSTVCSLCHDYNEGRIPPMAGTPSCFAASFTNPNGVTRCCHPGGPGVPHAAPAVFVSPSAHGPEAKKDFQFCQTCHGVPGTTLFDGGRATPCQNCHWAAGAHPTDWQGVGSYSHRNAGKMAADCSICHDFTSGRTAPLAGAPSCFSSTFTNGNGQTRSCHPGGPGEAHPVGQPWLDKKNAQFHGDSSLVCSSCHAVSSFCSQCHFGPTGSRSPPGSGWNHGQSGHRSYESYITVCNACHNVNRQYGNPPSNCHNCH